MAEFSVWYSEERVSKVWFVADDLEHAKELLRQVEEGELDFEDLPSVVSKDKSVDFGFETALTLEEV